MQEISACLGLRAKVAIPVVYMLQPLVKNNLYISGISPVVYYLRFWALKVMSNQVHL